MFIDTLQIDLKLKFKFTNSVLINLTSNQILHVSYLENTIYNYIVGYFKVSPPRIEQIKSISSYNYSFYISHVKNINKIK